MSQEDKTIGVVVHHHHESQSQSDQAQYGTFQGVNTYPPVGFPQPARPPGASDSYDSFHPHPYAHAYQAVPGYAVVEGRPVREGRLPCCGIGIGWFLFIIGFFLVGIPWYAGAIVILCSRVNHREKPGYVACAIAAILVTVAIILGVTKGARDW